MSSSSQPECAICLASCTHPVKLHCNHIFCFLCIKGASAQNRKCPMCRSQIADSYFDEPQLIEEIKDDQIPVFEDGYQWFYEGRNGWWLYDRGSSADIEAAYKAKKAKCEILIAGFMYIIDFVQMLQYRRHDPQRQRRIKRERNEPLIKGIAGLRTNISISNSPTTAEEGACAADPIVNPVSPEPETHQVSPVLSRGRPRTRSMPIDIPARPPITDQGLEAQIEQDLITRLENASINSIIDNQGHRYRETYL